MAGGEPVTRHFVELDDVMRIGARLMADARKCGDEAGADAIELFASEIQAEVQFTLYELERGSRNGDRS
jgi:hypothetical protein